MDLQTFAYERSSLTVKRQRSGLKVLFDRYLKDIGEYDGDIEAILEIAVETESMDGFGTEGLNV